jgi:biotin-dependent carboxylase-like uncharacterized protein
VTTALFEVAAPGLQTTVQDAGRPGLGHLGVPVSGACDRRSLAIANALVGNDVGAAALELTVQGPDLLVLVDAIVGLAGADLGGVERGSGRRLAPGRVHRLAAGERLSFPGSTQPTGCRAYLAVPGGIDVPVVLGSRSTCLAAGFGGIDGRPLRAGDRIASVRPPTAGPDEAALLLPADHGSIRVLPGPDPEPLDPLVTREWTVGAASDRMGLRLDGPPIERADDDGRRGSHGVLPGTVQLPPDGRPIVLLADAQPTGGYPVPAVVATADLSRLGQLGPGMRVRFETIDLRAARLALREERRDLLDRIRGLTADRGWDELWRSAGA